MRFLIALAAAALACGLASAQYTDPDVGPVGGAIDVTFSATPNYLDGLLAAMRGAARHASAPLRFSIALDAGDTTSEPAVRAAFPHLDATRLRFAVFRREWVAAIGCVWGRQVGYLHSPFTFTRFYLDRMFPDLRRVIVLDTDVAVRGDLARLAAVDVSGTGLAAVESCEHPYRMLFHLDDAAVRARLKDGDACGFNGGVLLADLGWWAAHNATGRLEGWMRQNCERRLYELGSQPPLDLVWPAGAYTRLDQRWNVRTLGWNPSVPRDKLDAAWLLHWNGPRKPWLRDGMYRAWWLPDST